MLSSLFAAPEDYFIPEWSGYVAQIPTSIGIWVLLPLLVGLARTLGRDA